MRLIAGFIALALMLPSVHAQKAPPTYDATAARSPIAPPSTDPFARSELREDQLENHKHYVNSAREVVHSPSRSKDGAVPPGASAQCRDGTYSFSRSHRGTCSHHGGVAAWL
jgi:hypothetical protein